MALIHTHKKLGAKCSQHKNRTRSSMGITHFFQTAQRYNINPKQQTKRTKNTIMKKKKEERIRICISISESAYNRLNLLCSFTGCTKSKLIDEALTGNNVFATK